jgi:phospholipid/cholesterol/gamma-HCH transport system permease protein
VSADAGDHPRESRTSLSPPPIGGLEHRAPLGARIAALVDQLGEVALMTGRTIRALGKRPYELRALFYQMESLGVQSTGIVATTSVFIGMVMTIQFAFGLQRFGGLEYIPRVIVLSFLRELGPTLTAIIVGGRIGSGMAAEVGAMNVTEQVDAIRALGADPHKKLVLPRVAAAVLVMPILSLLSDFLGVIGAMAVCQFEYGIRAQFFLRSSLEVVQMSDLFSGLGKTPVFGFIIAIVGCHFGLQTTGGTEGVGRSTTRTVVVVSIAILIADFFLTKIFVAFLPA